jgi:hypothetical protein
VTLLADTVYVPGGRLGMVCVAVTGWLNPPGPVTVTAAAEPLGKPKIVTLKLPMLGPLGPPSHPSRIIKSQSGLFIDPQLEPWRPELSCVLQRRRLQSPRPATFEPVWTEC